MEDRDFIDFKFGDHWASDFNLLAVSSGDRYSPPVYGSVNPNTAIIAGKVGVYKWKTQINEKVFNIKIAFDNINGQILNQIKEWLNPFKIDKLVFKEEPYKYYWVALNTEPKLDFLPFLEETKVVNGIAFKEGVYKGEFELQFVCFDNYGYSDWQSFDENYDYVVKEIEGEEFISFNDGSDNNLIITKIEGNSKQNVIEEVKGKTVSEEYITINDVNLDNGRITIGGNSWQETREGYNILNVPSVLNITSEEVNRLVDINIDADTNYTIKADKIDTDNTEATKMLFRFIDSDNADITYVYINPTDKAQTFSLKKNAVQVRIYSSNNHTTSAETNTTFTNLMIYKGTDLTKPYEPYGAMPSTEFESPIQNVTGNANATICNKNIANPKEVWENMRLHDAGNCSEVIEDGRECIKFANSRFRPDGVSQPFNLINFKYKENTAYTIRILAKANGLPASGAGTLYLRVVYRDGTASQKGINASNATSFVEFRILSDTSKTIEKIGFAFGTGLEWFIDKSSIFIAEGDTTDYTEHQDQSFTFPLTEGQRLMKGDYLADDGIHHKRGQVVFDGTENWADYATQVNGCYKGYATSKKTNSNFNSDNSLCNYFKTYKVASSTIKALDTCLSSDQNATYISVSNDVASTVDELKAWLASNPVTLEYELAEEAIEPYTEEQQAVYDEIYNCKIYKPTTHLFGTNTINPIFTLKYNYVLPSPSPEIPSEVKNVTNNINITVCNKNLLNPEKVIADSNNSDISLTEDGYIKFKTGAFPLILKPVKIKEKTAYTFKLICKSGVTIMNHINFIVYYTNGTKAILPHNRRYDTDEFEVKFTTNKEKTLEKVITNYTDSQVSYMKIDGSIIEEGETSTEYTEHQEQSFTFPLAEGQRLMKGDYLADDGIHHKRKQRTITEDMIEKVIETSFTELDYIAIKKPKDFIGYNKPNANASLMSCAREFEDWTFNNVSYINKYSCRLKYTYFMLGIQKNTTYEEIKDKIIGQTIEYDLAEEEIEPYTPEQQIVYDEIKNNLYSYEGTNHIFSNDEVSPKLSISYIPKQDIYIDYVVNQSNLLNDSAFYYENNIYKKSYFDAETGDATKSGISEDRPVYLYNAGTTATNLNLTFDMIIPAEGSPLVINTESCKLTDNGIQVLKQVSSISISDFSKYKPFLEIYDGTPSNWQIQIDSNLCEIYLKHKTNKTKIISLNKFNDNQSFLSLANCNFVDYSKPFPTLITAISGTALENTVFNKLSVGTSAQNYRLKNVDVEWKHTYL